MPLSAIPALVERGAAAVAAIGPPLRINAFGHVGDGNLHYNVFPPEGVARAEVAHLAAPVTRAVHDLVHDLGGSISAEHGIGRFKAAELLALRRPGADHGDARHQGGAGPGRDHEPRRGAGGGVTEPRRGAGDSPP